MNYRQQLLPYLLAIASVLVWRHSAWAEEPIKTADDYGAEAIDQSYFRNFSVTASSSIWGFIPIDVKGNDDDGQSDWSRVPTKEEYRLEPISFLGLSTNIETRDFNLQLSYASGRGFGASFGDSSLLKLLFQLTGIKYLDRLQFGSTIYDFVGGEALLLDRQSGVVYDETYFELHLRRFSMKYQLKKLFVAAQYLGYTIPRNIYLKQTQGSGEDQTSTYYPISDTLLKVDSKVVLVGVGIDNRKHVFKEGYLQPYKKDRALELSGSFLIGGGTYKLRDLFYDRQIDEGKLASVGLNGSVQLQHKLASMLTIGATIDLSIYIFAPLGLPNNLENNIASEGIPTDQLSLDFGTIDLLGRLYAFIRMDF